MSSAAPKVPLCCHATPQNPAIPTGRGLVPRTKPPSLHSFTSHKPLSFTSQINRLNTRSLFAFLPISPVPPISCSPGPHNHANVDDHDWEHPLLKSCARTLAALLVGSVVFAGRFACRPALSAVDAQRSASGAPMVEKAAAQDGVEEEEGEEDELAARMLEANPRDVEALKMALYGKMKKGRTREAVAYVERLIDVEPDEVEWRLLQALCYELMGRFSRAKQLFKDILEERPLLLRALHGLALVMHKNREGPAVFDMLNKALELARREQRVTEERNIRILISQMHVIKGDFEEGLKQFKSLIDENNGDLEGGLVRFQKLAEENPRDFRPYLCQGIIYSLLDRKKDAEEQFEIYRSLVPDEFPQRDFLDDVVLAAKTESQEQLKKDFQSEFSGRN